VVVLTLGGAFTVGYRLSAGDRETTAVAAPRLVDQVRSALQGAYYRPVPASVLRIENVRQMISALDDPYTAYLRPATYRLVRQETASTYTGIGASVLPAGHRFVVVSLLAGPAQAAGIRILGPPGTRVHLQLLRGGRRLDLQVRRAVIHAPPVQARVVSYVGHRYGVVAVSSFSVGTAVLVRRELRRLDHAGAKGLVLDLREDPGGFVAQAVNVTSLFINHGVVVSLQGLHQPQEVLRASPGSATALPLVVLVDRYTASAAEIVAAALRDNHRATIVGERTFGKALVQAVDPLTNGAALELSIAHYTTPSGQDLSGVGLEPQIPARDDPRTGQDEALSTALRVLTRPAS
jgi:carboxyl-terminal processing protease